MVYRMPRRFSMLIYGHQCIEDDSGNLSFFSHASNVRTSIAYQIFQRGPRERAAARVEMGGTGR